MDHLIIAIAALLIGFGKGGIAGAGAIVTPLLALSMSATTAIGNTLPLLIFADMFALRVYWRKWDLRHIRLLLPAAVVGIVLGTTLLASLAQHEDILKKIIAIISLIVVIYKIVSDRLRTVQYQPHKWHGYLAGGGAGFTSALAHAGGPPYLAYMMLQKLDPIAFMGTTTLFFASVNLIKVPGFLLTNVMDFQQLLSIAWALPLIPLGVWVGKRFVLWVSPQMFEAVIQVSLLLLALLLLIR